MTNFKLTLLPFLLFPILIFAQHNNSELPFSINENGDAPDKSAIFEVQSKDKGVLIPRMDFCDIEKIPNPAQGLMIFDTEYNCLRIYINDKWDCLYQKTEVGETEGNLTGWKHLDNYSFNESFHGGLEIDGAGNIYILSELDSNYYVYLRKYSSKGELLWEIDLTEMAYFMEDLEVSENGDVYITGYKSRWKDLVIGDFEAIDTIPEYTFIAKLNTNGGVEDFYHMPNEHYNLALSKTGNLYYASRDGAIGKITPNGADNWTFNNNEVNLNISVSSEEYICILYVEDRSYPQNLVTLMTLDSSGNSEASKTITSPNGIGVFDICADEQNNFYIGLSYTDNYYYDGGLLSNTINGNGTSILYLDQALNKIRSKNFEQAPDFYRNPEMTLDTSGNLYVTGYRDLNLVNGLNNGQVSLLHAFDVSNGNLIFKESIKLPGYSNGVIDVSPNGDCIYTLNMFNENAKIGNTLLKNDKLVTAVVKFCAQ